MKDKEFWTHERLRKLIFGNLRKHGHNKTLMIGIFQLGRIYGFTEKEVGDMVRECMKKQSYSDTSIRKYLPQGAKNISKSH